MSWQTFALTAIVLATCLLLPSASGADEDDTAKNATSYRLSRDVLPFHYNLYIETYLGDDKQGFKFLGQVDIMFSAKAPGVQEVRVHAKDLQINKTLMKLSSESGDVPAIKETTYDEHSEFLVLFLSSPLKQDAVYKLQLSFSAPLNEGLAGYYRSSYQDRATNQTRWMAVTQFESTDARRAFPCFDEPSFKATFNISIAHLNKYTALSNMPVERYELMPDRRGWKVDYFQRTERMSTYLVAFMVSDFHHMVSHTANHAVMFRVWARQDALRQAAYATDIGPKILSFYEEFFQVPYPLPKQDMVAIPDFAAGAMENWGLITYRERTLLYDPHVSSPQAKRDVASVVAHELAHQWFGNLVTMYWWSDLWLNEGFATYVSSLGVDAVHPLWKSSLSDVVTNMLTVFDFDALETSHALSVPIKHPSEISQIFDTISYKKGSFLIRMMSNFLGEDVFRNGLTNYLRMHRLDNAEQDDLWAALTAEAHREGVLPLNMSVKSVMDTWTLQTGYPVLTVTRDYSRGVINITQQRYLSYDHGDSRRTTEESCWQIPVTYATAKDPESTYKMWLHCAGDHGSVIEKEIPAELTQWLILNINATGLFRVKYDERGWQLLSEALDNDAQVVSALNRAQLIEDAMSLAWSGDIPYRTALLVISYLSHEPDYLPWKAASNNLRVLMRLMQRTSSYGLFREFLLALMEEPMQEWSDLDKPLKEDDLEAFRHRGLMVSWACRLEKHFCVHQANELFRTWMLEQNPDRDVPIPRGLRLEVTCTAVRHGGIREWDFAWERYLASNVASERVEMLSALACAKEPWLLQRLLEWSVQDGKGIRRQDSTAVFSAVAHNVYGFHVAKEFLMKNIAELHKFHSPKTGVLSRYVKALAEHMYQETELNEFDEFTANSTAYLEKVTLGVKQARDKITVNIAWHRNHFQEFVALLEEITK